ncbi:MAG: NAD(P)-dependent oxidoreductase [Candidatus Moranbacteria bacterium]|nr:NAD(P)-dependent oxidoreductase [Candidatus Moranbacteria bacterium]
MKTTVLILGAKGMLGQSLVKVFLDDTLFEVVSWDKEDLDLTDEKSLWEKITEAWPDIIINASAYNFVDLCQKNEEEYRKAVLINTRVPSILAQIAQDLRAILVHYSTDYVFDGKKPRYRGEGRAPGCCGSGCLGCSYFRKDGIFDGYREHDKPQPLSLYGKTKYDGEMEIEKKTDQYYIIRLSKLFGKPAQSEYAKKSFFDIILEKGKSQDVVEVIDDEKSCFTYAPDLALATKELIQEENAFGIYHLVNEGTVTWFEAVQYLFEHVGLSTKVVPVTASFFTRDAQRPSQSTLLNTKVKPLRSWKEALNVHLNEDIS